MRFTTLDELDSYVTALEQRYTHKHGLDFNNPATERLRDYLVAIRLELIASEFEHTTDPTNIDSYTVDQIDALKTYAEQYRSRADTHSTQSTAQSTQIHSETLPSEAR